MNKTIFLVAGEASGDILGARLIKALKQIYPQAHFKGIGGPLMQAEGFESLFAMERLAVMGIIPILKRLPELLKMRSRLAKMIIAAQPDCFIGIDAPEFNIGLEHKLKKTGIRTVQYVSPSVWAWREKRIFKIAKSVSLMVCLFPFELSIYREHKVPAVCIGHPLANEIPMFPERGAERERLGLDPDSLIIALLPGSRGSEVSHLLPDFTMAAEILTRQHAGVKFILPVANIKRQQQIERYLDQNKPNIELQLFNGKSRQVMTAADVILVASGTATLEAMLIKKPMLVAYKVSNFSYWIFKKLLRISSFSLPNLLAKEKLVEELIQENCEPETLAKAMNRLIENRSDSPQVQRFYELHQQLKLGGSQAAAEAIKELMEAN